MSELALVGRPEVPDCFIKCLMFQVIAGHWHNIEKSQDRVFQ
jgi:hypothetical protein